MGNAIVAGIKDKKPAEQPEEPKTPQSSSEPVIYFSKPAPNSTQLTPEQEMELRQELADREEAEAWKALQKQKYGEDFHDKTPEERESVVVISDSGAVGGNASFGLGSGGRSVSRVHTHSLTAGDVANIAGRATKQFLEWNELMYKWLKELASSSPSCDCEQD